MFSIEPPIPAARRRLRPGMRPLGALLAALALLLGLASPADAARQTVDGTGDIQKMWVNNGSSAVVVKVFGPNVGICGQWVWVAMRDRDGTKYTARGACYPGDPNQGGGWHTSLERGSALVSCGGFKLRYVTAHGFWRVEVPRSCLGRLANQIKVTAELNAGPTPSAAGPTSWLARG